MSGSDTALPLAGLRAGVLRAGLLLGDAPAVGEVAREDPVRSLDDLLALAEPGDDLDLRLAREPGLDRADLRDPVLDHEHHLAEGLAARLLRGRGRRRGGRLV